MNGTHTKHCELRALMTQALETCIQLQAYTNDNFNIFLSDDDVKITEVIGTREKIVETLIGIEYKIDIILDEVDAYGYGSSLPQDVDEIRQSVRAVLSDVSARDMEIMKSISSRMQMYKIETLKARNKKSLSAYMRTTFSNEAGDSVDYSK